jgi:hypothetical protein
MKVLIVCESLFGNTEMLAELVRKGLGRADCETELVEVGHAFAEPPDLSRYDLLVVAAPTHALSLSRPESRAEAVAKGADPRREKIGVREWLDTFGEALPDPAPRVAVFDTRVGKARHWPGSAAHRAARRLRLAGFDVIERTSFYVDGVSGPLSPGEAERAERWGAQLGARACGQVRPRDGAANPG